MAALPSPTQVAGSHAAIFEAYYNQVDPNGQGQIGAMDAARFLKKSDLSDIILGKIWDMADPQSRGCLDKSGMFVALKLCAVAQAGHNLSMANLSLELPPPKMGEIPKIRTGDWSIKPSERAKYDQLFDNLQPTNGYIQGNKVKGVLMNSKLPLDTLGKIWDLADMDKDGMLDRHEFIVAMHLVYKALEKYAIPNVLPPELMPPGKRKDIVIPPMSKSPAPAAVVPPVLPPIPNISAVNSLAGLDTVKPPSIQQWVVSVEDQVAANELFLKADMDMDGFVSGAEIKDVFLQSKLPQHVLANIWSLCDICQSGKLNKEQFALAMWLIKQKLRNKEIPESLTTEMVPPSLRKICDGAAENNNVSGYANPELNMISKDIAELARERHTMEQDIAQKEADIKIKSGEIKSLQSELDTLAATLKQLENQKGEAQKRLNDLKAQRADIDRELSEIETEIREEQEKVDKLRQQAEEQESVLRVQEEELNSKRQELEGLRQEEQQLEEQQSKNRDQLNDLTKILQDTQLEISQAKVKITHLEEQQRQMSDVIALYDSAIASGDASIVPDTSLQFKPDIDELDYEGSKQQSTTKMNGIESERGDSFSDSNVSGFGDRDPFASGKAKDAFTSKGDPFGEGFQPQIPTSGFDNDPFTAFNNQTAYDPFGDGKSESKPETAQASKDPFGDDPFAALHAPTRAESPSPALPPKKAKQPPPRPAPPRPSAGPSGPLRAAPAPPVPSPTPDTFVISNSDPFSSQQSDSNNGNAFGASGFADFANFDSKPEPLPSRVTLPRSSNVNRLQTTTPTHTAKLPDFTEDPFRDYRYDDPFAISDPFADDITEDSNANKYSVPDGGKLDPFGFGPSMSRVPKDDSFARAFDSNFVNTFPLVRSKADKNTNKFDADFSKAFADSNNKNVTPKDADLANKSTNVKLKTIDANFTFPNGNFKKYVGFTSRTKAINDTYFSKKKDKNSVDKSWNGNKNAWKMTEEEQIAWATRESEAEEERRKRQIEAEEMDLILTIDRSKKDVW